MTSPLAAGAEERISDELLLQYLRPWYAALSITIYRDIKSMAFELLERRHSIDHALKVRQRMEQTPVTATEAEATRREWSER